MTSTLPELVNFKSIPPSCEKKVFWCFKGDKNTTKWLIKGKKINNHSQSLEQKQKNRWLVAGVFLQSILL